LDKTKWRFLSWTFLNNRLFFEQTVLLQHYNNFSWVTAKDMYRSILDRLLSPEKRFDERLFKLVHNRKETLNSE